MINKAHHFGAKVLLQTNHCTLKFKKMLNGMQYDDANREYNDIIRKAADETGVVLCDIHKYFEEFNKEKLSKCIIPEPDLLHLSEEGNYEYAACIYPYLCDIIASAKK